MPADKQTQNLVDEISSRIEDLYNGNEDNVSSALGFLILKILNLKYKPVLSEENISLIKGNYPKAIDEDIQERGLSEAGLAQFLAIFQTMSKIAIDYSPLTNCQSDQKNDLSPSTKPTKAQEFAEEAYLNIRNTGFTPFGSATTMIMLGMSAAQAEGVSPFKIARPLVDALGGAFKNASRNSKAAEESAITAISQQLGVSRKEAMKYVNSYKEMKSRGEL
jgi:hypothetical protein